MRLFITIGIMGLIFQGAWAMDGDKFSSNNPKRSKPVLSIVPYPTFEVDKLNENDFQQIDSIESFVNSVSYPEQSKNSIIVAVDVDDTLIGLNKKILDPQTPSYLAKLAKNGVYVLAITARRTDEETMTSTYNCLKKAGIDFLDLSAVAKENGALAFNSTVELQNILHSYQDNILYTNGDLGAKGAALLDLCVQQRIDVNKCIVYFLDDNPTEVLEFQNTMNQNEIKCFSFQLKKMKEKG